MTFDEKRYNNHNKEHDNHDVIIMLMSTYITYLHTPLTLSINRETYINSPQRQHEEEFYLHFNIRRN